MAVGPNGFRPASVPERGARLALGGNFEVLPSGVRGGAALFPQSLFGGDARCCQRGGLSFALSLAAALSAAPARSCQGLAFADDDVLASEVGWYQNGVPRYGRFLRVVQRIMQAAALFPFMG